MLHPVLMAARETVNAMGGTAIAAKMLGKADTTLQHELAGSGTNKLGLVDALRLVHASQDHRIAMAFSAECGGCHLPLPALGDGTDATIDTVSSFVREVGEALTAVATATADGRVTDNELAAVERQALDVLGALHQLRAHMRHLNTVSKPAFERRPSLADVPFPKVVA